MFAFPGFLLPRVSSRRPRREEAGISLAPKSTFPLAQIVSHYLDSQLHDWKLIIVTPKRGFAIQTVNIAWAGQSFQWVSRGQRKASSSPRHTEDAVEPEQQTLRLRAMHHWSQTMLTFQVVLGKALDLWGLLPDLTWRSMMPASVDSCKINWSKEKHSHQLVLL